MDKHFSATDNEQLVEIVRMHEYLYNVKHPLYNELLTKQNAWREISEILERPVEDCKKRWKNIKDAHRRRRKLGKFGRTSKSPLVKLVSFLDDVKIRPRDYFPKLNEFKKTTDTNINIEFGQGSDSAASSVAIKKDDDHIYNIENDASLDQNTNNECITDSEATIHFPDPLSTYGKSEQANDNTFITNSTIGNILNVMQKDLKRVKQIVGKQEDSVDLFFRSLSMSVKNLQPHLINQAKIKMLQLVIDLESQNNYTQTELNENKDTKI